MGKVRYGQHGYVGSSMSERAVEAYANGEMPKSKWTKAAMLYAIDNQLNEFEDDQKITSEEREELFTAINAMKKEEMFSTFMEYSSWHHTSKFANATDFYRITEDIEDYRRFAIHTIPDTTVGQHSNELIGEQIEREKQQAQERARIEAERHIDQHKFDALLAQGVTDFSGKIFENITLENLNLEGVDLFGSQFKNCTIRNSTFNHASLRRVAFSGNIHNSRIMNSEGDLEALTSLCTIDGLDIRNSQMSVSIDSWDRNDHGYANNITFRDCGNATLITGRLSVANLTIDNVEKLNVKAYRTDFTQLTVVNSSINPIQTRHTTITDSTITDSSINMGWGTFTAFDYQDLNIANTHMENITLTSHTGITPQQYGLEAITFTNSSFQGVLSDGKNSQPYATADTALTTSQENPQHNEPTTEENTMDNRNKLTQDEFIELYDNGERNFSNKKLSHLDLSDMDLTNCDFTNTEIRDVNFANSTLTGSDFTNAIFTDNYCHKTQLDHTTLTNALINGCDFTEASLGTNLTTGTTFTNNEFFHTYPTGRTLKDDAPLPRPSLQEIEAETDNKIPDLSHLDLSHMDLSNMNLSNADFRGSNLTDTNLEACDLSDTYFGGTLLNHTNLTGANCYNADFDGAVIHQSNFTDADLSWTTIFNSLFVNNDFTNAEMASTSITYTIGRNNTVPAQVEKIINNQPTLTHPSHTQPYASADTALTTSQENTPLRKENEPTQLGKEGIRNLIAKQTQQKIQLGETQAPLTQQQEQQHPNR